MDKMILARICWLSKEEGGRQMLPIGNKYAPIVKIKNSMVDSDERWSLFVNNKSKISDVESLADIKYLSDEAPDNLVKGVEFELYEGPKLVATGIVL